LYGFEKEETNSYWQDCKIARLQDCKSVRAINDILKWSENKVFQKKVIILLDQI